MLRLNLFSKTLNGYILSFFVLKYVSMILFADLSHIFVALQPLENCLTKGNRHFELRPRPKIVHSKIWSADMDMESPEMSKLFESSIVLKEEFETVICAFVFWRHLFDKKDGENHAHAIMRTLFFREVLLGIMRIWDDSSHNKLSLSMFRIGKYMRDRRIIEFLSAKGEKEFSSLLDGMDDRITSQLASKRPSVQKDSVRNIEDKALRINEIIERYGKNKRADLKNFRDVRDNLIAHRNIRFQSESIEMIKETEKIYADTSSIIENLISILGCETWEIRKVEDVYRKQLPDLKL